MVKQRKILIVDDEEEIRELLEVFFEMDGYAVETAESGSLAYTRLKSGGVDLVVSDIRMPGGSGIDLLKSVNLDNTMSVPIILLTGYSDLSSEEATELGALDVLRKPIKSDELLGIVRSVFSEVNQASS